MHTQPQNSGQTLAAQVAHPTDQKAAEVVAAAAPADSADIAQPSANQICEDLVSPSQRHLQQYLVIVASFLRLRDAFVALPAASRLMHERLGFNLQVFSG